MDAALEKLLHDVPDAVSARRFIGQFAAAHPSQAKKLMRSPGLLSDVVTLASYSPLLAATLQQNPEYISWLSNKRGESGSSTKEEVLESLARFAMTHSQLELQVVLARFRRRELLRIFLRDVRRLATVAEITEEISNLADAILEFALRSARQEMDNRFGTPLETDERGRSKPAEICIVALGKLGSKELNYSSDIDLLFIYSAEGETSGHGSRGTVTNREYFIKLAEYVTKLIGERIGEGAAYRVDMRLRPHGRIGALALSLADTVRYYRNEARTWERQVLIRSRASAGEQAIFKEFFRRVESSVFSPNETIENALGNVRSSKQQIDVKHLHKRGYDVKLGRGGIREIEFIAQALQLAYGGRDRWLRSPHTLISLARLADRGLISDAELTELYDAYDFLRRLEHILQMENGLQTHLLPDNPEKRAPVGRKMGFADALELEGRLKRHTDAVHRVFRRIFHDAADTSPLPADYGRPNGVSSSGRAAAAETTKLKSLQKLSPRYAEQLAKRPELFAGKAPELNNLATRDYSSLLQAAVEEPTYGRQLAELRRRWSAELLEIVAADITGAADIRSVKRLQTRLAEASIAAAAAITERQLVRRYGKFEGPLRLGVLGLGKIGGAGLDYESDLDLVMTFDDEAPTPVNLTHAEIYGRAVEIFVSVMSAMTREGNLYRVDLRLRPHGKGGPSAISRRAFVEYMRTGAAIWEMLAFVKLRAVGGDVELAREAEDEVRAVIHERAKALNPEELRQETRRMRLRLEEERSRGRRGRDVDIKYGPGGMLDIYFAMRYLQLRDDVPDDRENRSSAHMLGRLRTAGSLGAEEYEGFAGGYEFLSQVDHNLRLTVGRTTRLPAANTSALDAIAARMGLGSRSELMEKLTAHRLEIREIFDRIVSG